MILSRALLLFLCELYISVDFISAQIFLTTTTQYPTVLPAQCYSYTTINDSSRHVTSGENFDCDKSIISDPTWIRFTGESGTQLATSPTASKRCGTQITGWYSGTMPTASRTVTDGRVCFAWDNNICQWSSPISITNCGSFYVYQLTTPPVCPARYCTNTPNYPTTITSTTTTTTTPNNLPQCNEYTTVDDPSRSVDATGYAKQCDQSNSLFSTDKWIRFVGAGGTQIPTTVTKPNQCSTDAGGWYSSSMPYEPYTTKNGTICFSWDSNSCWSSSAAQVTNCGSFYVYRLKSPTGCSLRYCTETPKIPTTTTSTTTTITTTTTINYAPQCYNYATINDPTRSVNETGQTVCDQAIFNSTQTWIRFVGTGGTQIPTVPIAPNHCGTQASGWYQGEMPDALYATKNGTACFAWNSNMCYFNNDISVTNCGSYYVYLLNSPSQCNLRYCTDTPTIPLTTSTITTTTQTTTITTAIYSPQCYNNTVINDESRNVEKYSGNNCDRAMLSSGPMWIRFVGAGGTQIPTNPIGGNRCGTQAPGWYAGPMPNTQGTTFTGMMCFTWESNTCQWNTSALVTNCGSYYVYHLNSPPVCDMRYCTTQISSVKTMKKSMGRISLFFDNVRNFFKKLLN